jgi:TRAP-type transport system small permease protein
VLLRVEHRLALWLRRILDLTSYLSGIALFLIAVVITIDVLRRWLIGEPIIGVFETTRVALVLVTFFALPTVQYYGRQLSVDVIYGQTRGRLAACLRVLEYTFSLGLFGALFWVTTREWLRAYQGGFLLRGMIEIPEAVPLSFIALGSLLIALVSSLLLVRALRDVLTGGTESVPLRGPDPDDEQIVRYDL